MNNFKTILVYGKTHVIRELERKTPFFTQDGKRTDLVPQPDYLQTGMCLCGILSPKQTLDEFANEYEKRKSGTPEESHSL